MITLIAIIALIPTALLLIDYARHDRFGGTRSVRHQVDELGPLEDREHLVPSLR